MISLLNIITAAACSCCCCCCWCCCCGRRFHWKAIFIFEVSGLLTPSWHRRPLTLSQPFFSFFCFGHLDSAKTPRRAAAGAVNTAASCQAVCSCCRCCRGAYLCYGCCWPNCWSDCCSCPCHCCSWLPAIAGLVARCGWVMLPSHCSVRPLLACGSSGLLSLFVCVASSF